VAAPSGDELVAEFLPQIGNVDIEQVRERIFVFVEEMLVKLAARNHAAAVLREEFEQRVFARGQRHFPVRATHAACGKIDGSSGDDERRCGVPGGPANERAEAGQQFIEVERLR
jgi:hypothetical protein